LLTTLEKLVKVGARIVRHGRYVVLQLAELAVPPSTVRRDHASDRSSPIRTAPGMSWVAAMRSPQQRSCDHNQTEKRLKLAPKASREARKIGSARSELLPMSPGLPAALEGRKLDRQRPIASTATSRPDRPLVLVCRQLDHGGAQARPREDPDLLSDTVIEVEPPGPPGRGQRKRPSSAGSGCDGGRSSRSGTDSTLVRVLLPHIFGSTKRFRTGLVLMEIGF
jgi:hypothetical protein